jgi:hypothetical protein
LPCLSVSKVLSGLVSFPLLSKRALCHMLCHLWIRFVSINLGCD